MAELQIIPKDSSNYSREVIKIASTGAVLAGSVIAPNLLSLLAKTISPSKPDRALRALRYSRDKGWVTFRETHDGVEIALTKAGRIKWQSIDLETPLHERKWDGKWRLVLFDIPVGKRHNANELRKHLRLLGFRLLQHSVWITPYPCATKIAVIRQIYDIKDHVRIVEVSAIEREQELITLFGLNTKNG